MLPDDPTVLSISIEVNENSNSDLQVRVNHSYHYNITVGITSYLKKDQHCIKVVLLSVLLRS